MLDNERSMPFYEYRRPDGTILEVMQKMSDPPMTEDPETGVPLERVFHPIAVHFKGKGFYNTDYGTKNRAREKAADDSKKKSDSDSKSESKSDSKSESKSDSKSDSGEKKSTDSTAVKKLNEAKSAAKS
jgi:predicted nucleic acid-binding Zn ribbon protein